MTNTSEPKYDITALLDILIERVENLEMEVRFLREDMDNKEEKKRDPLEDY